jgi:hypothetical protein
MIVDVTVRELNSEYLFTVTGTVEKPLEIGRTPTGERRIFRKFLGPIFLREWSPREARSCELLDQAVANCVGGKIGIGLQIHFLKHSRTVGADRFDA